QCRAGPSGLAARLDAFLLVRMAAEDPRRAELAQLVPDHVLGHEHVVEDAAVVHLEGEPDELRNDRAGARPGLQRLAASRLVQALHLLVQAFVDVRTFLQTASHAFTSQTSARGPTCSIRPFAARNAC